MDKRKYWLVSILVVSLLIVTGIVLITFQLLNKPKLANTLTSVYPPNPVIPFIIPTPPVPLEEFNQRLDPYQLIKQTEKDMEAWLTEQKANPDANASFTPFAPFPVLTNLRGALFEGKGIYNDLWLTDYRKFKAIGSIEHIFSDKLVKTQDFMIQMLLDERPLQFRANEGAFSYQHIYTLGRAERYTYTLETGELPTGVHNLHILFFPYIGAKYPDPLYQVQTGQKMHAQKYRIYVGATTPSDKVEFYDWSTKPTPNKDLRDAFYINDNPDGFSPDNDFSVSNWKGINKIEAGKPVSYTLVLNNVFDVDREYCLVAYLDYQVVPILGEQTRACGIVKAGYVGLLHGTFIAPTTPGDHRFEVLRIDNPLLKESYFRFDLMPELSTVVSSGRVFFTIPQ